MPKSYAKSAPTAGKYFGFMERGSSEFAKAVIGKYDEGQCQLAEHPLNDRIQRAHAFYYSRDPKTGEQDTTQRRSGGSEGEMIFADVNEFRSLLSQQKVNATSTPPAWAPIATNSDSAVLVGTRIARAVLEYYRQNGGIEQQVSRLVESCLVMGSAWIGAVWDVRRGREIAVRDDETLIYEGDFEFSVKTPYDVVVDPHSEDFNKPRWMIVRRKVNRYDLAARYPDHREAIMNSAMWLTDAFASLSTGVATDDAYNDNEDVCHVLEVYFARTDSLPAGRQALVINSDTVAYDLYGTDMVPDPKNPAALLEVSVGLDYEEIPYIRLAQSEVIFERFPHADSHDLMLPVEMYQAAVGKIETLQTAKANVFGKPKGSDWLETQVGGQKVIEFDPGQKPETFVLFGADANDFQYAEFCRTLGQRQAVVSSAQRGEGEKGASGSKEAFVASSSQTFAAGFARYVTKVWEALGTHIIRTLASHARAERVISLVGIENKQEAYAFTGKHLASVTRVQVHESNPALDSPQGRVESAFKLFNMSAGKMDLERFMQLARTGQLDLADEQYNDEDMLIKNEGELIKQGKFDDVFVIKWHRHSRHIKDHIDDLYDINPNDEPDKFDALVAHIDRHILFLSPTLPDGSPNPEFDPRALLVIGEQPFPIFGPDGNPLQGAPGMPVGGPGAQAAPPDGGAPPPQPGDGAPATPDLPGGPAQVRMPNAPTNPGTGQPANMPPIQNTMPAQAAM